MIARTRRVALVLIALTLALGLASPANVEAQATTARISGTITSGTEGFAILDSVQLRMIVLDGSRVGDALPATVTGGKFSVEVPLAPGRVFVPHLVYEGVDYFAQAVSFTDGSVTAVRDFLVYGVTREAPGLAIVSSTVTVVAIDREQGKLGLLREDMVANPSDRVFIGDDRRVTLRIPAPTGTTEADGDSAEGTFTFERGVVTTTVPIRPGKLTSIVTRYVVNYDRDADRYGLRVTSPLQAERLVVRVPEGYAREVQPDSGARRADDERVGSQGEAQVLKVAQSTASVRPGGGIVVNLVGLSALTIQTNPLTEPKGAVIAALVALAIIGGGTVAAWRWRPAA